MAQVVEHILGKDEVTSSNLVSSSKKKDTRKRVFSFFIAPSRKRSGIAARRAGRFWRPGDIRPYGVVSVGSVGAGIARSAVTAQAGAVDLGRGRVLY